MRKTRFPNKLLLKKWSKKYFKIQKTLQPAVKKPAKQPKKIWTKILSLVLNKLIFVMKYLIFCRKYSKTIDSVWSQKLMNNFVKSYIASFYAILLVRNVPQTLLYPKRVKFHIQMKLKSSTNKRIKFLWIQRQLRKANKLNLMLFLNQA